MTLNKNHIKFVRTNPLAVIPTRAHETDVGWDLTVIKEHKKISKHITMYDTGISISPPRGYHTEIVPRSSLAKSGYILCNSIGIIDNDYRGNLLIAIMKVDETLPDLELPFCKFQLIVRKTETMKMVEVFDLDSTERDKGGFGSSDLNYVV